MTTTDPRPAAPPLERSLQRRLTVGMFVVMLSIAFEGMSVATAMPEAARELGGLRSYAWAFSAFLVGMLLATVAAGRVADRQGAAAPLRLGIAVFVVGLVLASLAPTMPALVGARLVQGLGGGLVSTAFFVAIAEAYAEPDRPRVYTWLSTAWLLPAFIGPPVAGWLAETWSWRWVFAAVAPVAVAGAVLLVPVMRALPRRSSTDAQRASLLAATGVAAGVLAFQAGGQRLDLVGLGLAVAGAVALGLAVPRLMPARYFRLGRGLPAALASRALLPGAFFGAEAFLPLMLVEERGLSLAAAGTTLTVGAVGWTFGSWLQSRPWLRVRRDRLITAGATAVTTGVLLAAATAAAPGLPTPLAVAGWTVAGLGMGLASSSIALVVMRLSPAAERGRHGASLLLSEGLGSAVFVGAGGTVYAALRPGGHPPVTFGFTLAAMVLVALVAVVASLRIGSVHLVAGER